MPEAVPSIFRDAEERSPSDVIPVLDLGPFLAGDPGALSPLADQVRRALQDIGFFFVENHGVPQTLIDRVFEENARFHALPEDRKRPLLVNRRGVGYMPSGLQQPKYSDDEPDRKPDLGEAFFLGRERNRDTGPDPLYQGGKNPVIQFSHPGPAHAGWLH